MASWESGQKMMKMKIMRKKMGLRRTRRREDRKQTFAEQERRARDASIDRIEPEGEAKADVPNKKT